mmetsp:Transcript_125732/g.363730  ORF Transcript_125732/g.363730 Transcript_125732/m.363730 type:complete len:298 (-) Transcript_125732:1229-2122(-)
MPLSQYQGLLIQCLSHSCEELERHRTEWIHGGEQKCQHRVAVLADELVPQLLQVRRRMCKEQMLGQVVCPHHLDFPVLVAIHELRVLLLAVEGRAHEVVGVQGVGLTACGEDQGVGHLAVRVEGVLVRHVHPGLVGRAGAGHHDHHGHEDADGAREVPLDRQQGLPLGCRSRHCELEGVAHLELEPGEVEVLAHAVGQRGHGDVDRDGYYNVPWAAGDDAAQLEIRPAHVRLRLLEHIIAFRASAAPREAILQRHVVDVVKLAALPLLLLFLALWRAEEGQDREQGRHEGQLYEHAR